MDTKLEICNMALITAGEEPLVSFSTKSDVRVIACEMFYLPTIKEVGRDHDWNCLRCRKEIAASSESPDFGYDYKYELPANPWCIAVRKINNDLLAKWRIEGRVLLTDETECQMEYTGLITNPAEYDSLLVEAIYTKMAMKIIKKITGANESTTINLMRLYQGVLASARLADFKESGINAMEATQLEDSRN